MANKSFVIEYIIRARDRYTRVTQKAAEATKRLQDRIKAAKKSMERFTAGARRGGAVLTAGVTAPIMYLANRLKNAARDAEETRSKFRTVFRDIGESAQASANDLAKNYGLAGTEARKLLSDTGDLLSGFGFTQKESLALSTQVNKLAVDLASFQNLEGGAARASEALTKALLGEREQVKALGIAILEKDVKQKIGLMIAEGHQFRSRRQAKAQATLALAIEQSKNSIGDFAKTQMQLANQERITSSRIQDLKESFGRVLLPIALKITKAIRRFVEYLNDISPAGKRAILIIAGIAAAIGPLLLAIGGLGVVVPAITAGFAAIAPVVAAAFGPAAVFAAALAAIAVVVIRNWDAVRAFFRGFTVGLNRSFGPTFEKMTALFRNAASVIGELFGSDGQATRDLRGFANVGELIGDIIGGAMTKIFNGLAGVGEILGQLIGAITNLDFGQFDFERIKAQFLGTATPPVIAESRVGVDVNVGLDRGLKQTTPAATTTTAPRRTDVGAMVAQ